MKLDESNVRARSIRSSFAKSATMRSSKHDYEKCSSNNDSRDEKSLEEFRSKRVDESKVD
jgi:hypothetical protein